MNAGRLPRRIRIEPWLKDHCIGVEKKIVLPAVETMLFLAAECAAAHPKADIRVMEEARFGKFLEIPATAAAVPALVEASPSQGGRIRMQLLSHIQGKTMARLKEHGSVSFPAEKAPLESSAVDPAPPAHPCAEIPAADIYRQLVPFGPHYHTLRQSLYLSEDGAWGRLKAPELPLVYAVQESLGSPFPLDGAMHAACVLGQRLVDFVPFPVGFTRRTVSRPTRPGGSYLTRVTLVGRASDQLVFELQIFSDQGQLYETVTGLRMRDVGVSTKK